MRLVVSSVLAWCLIFHGGHLWSAPKQDLIHLRARIESLQKELSSNEESRTEAADALRDSEKTISDTTRMINDLTKQLKEINAELGSLQTRSKNISDVIQRQQQQLGTVLRYQYAGGRHDTLKLLLNHTDPTQQARELHYYTYIARARADFLKGLRDNLVNLNMLTEESRIKSEKLAILKLEQANHRERLEKERKSRQVLLTRVSKQVEQQRREISKLRRDEQRLSKLVEKLGKVLSKKKESIPLKNLQIPDSSYDRNPFRSLKGKLNLPIRGELVNRFGSPRSDGGVTWKGLFIRSESGLDVKAVAAGRIVFADWLRGFGNLLIIDHGQGYMSLYGNNETLYKEVGEPVKGGDTVAAVGNTGGNPDSGLYFELRYQGNPIDPLTWVTLK